jgi:hypothetical protein
MLETNSITDLQSLWRDPYAQWHAAGMPSFDQQDASPWKQILVKFRTKEDKEHFASTFNFDLTDRTNSVWHPVKHRDPNGLSRYVEKGYKYNGEDDIRLSESQPRYPIYIISKGRGKYGPHTAKALYNMGVDFRIAVEPQDYESYKASPYIREDQIYVLPFSNHGLGSGPARNWCWEHAKAEGHKRHWLMDDNIQEFWKLHKNKRYRVEKGAAPFTSTEDFVDRYENIAFAGLQYKFFAIDDCAYAPFILNTRIMSCFLIDNDVDLRWRGKYNEDVDLSIRAMKEGYVTMMFYSFLCGKLRTGTVKGGNTEEIYNNYQDDASYNKSRMLYEMHPDCVELIERYGRAHHHVNLDKIINKHTGLSARQNAPILKKGTKIVNAVNNYGLELIRDHGTPNAYVDETFTMNEYPKGRHSIHE